MARTEGKRSEPKTRASARPAVVRPTLPEAEEPSSDLGRKVILVAAILIGLVVVVVLGITLAGEEERDTAEGSLTLPYVAVTGGALPLFNDPADDAAVGLPMPEVSSSDFSGFPASVTNDGVPKLIVFLAHWCSHCEREVPALQAWIDQNGIPDGVDMVSVATSISDIRPNYPPDAWLEREGWTPRVVVDDAAGSISSAFGLNAFPYYVLVDGSGTVVQRLAGGQSPEFVGLMLYSLAESG